MSIPGHLPRDATIADGAEWIWQWAAGHPEAIWILDYYHLKERIWRTAREVYGDGTAKAAAWVEGMMDRLWRGHRWAAYHELDRLRPRSAGKRKELMTLLQFLTMFQGMMEYRKHRRLGRTIGSGTVESMVKQLFGMRLKGPGMFWSKPGAQNVLHLRALYIVERWDEVIRDANITLKE